MISKMTKYSFILLNGEKDSLLGAIQKTGLMDIRRESKPVDRHSAQMLAKAESHRNIIRTASNAVSEISALQKEKEKEAEILRPWGDFDPESFRALQESGYNIHYYIVPATKFRPEWKDICPLEIISMGDSVYFVTILPAGAQNPLPVQETDAPNYSYKTPEALAKELDNAKKEAEARRDSLKEREKKIEASYRSIMADLDLYLASQAAVPAAENTIETLIGYAPTERDAEVCAVLDATGVYYFKEAATVEDNPPIELSNNKFTSMFRVLTDMYGRPSYDGFDPTPFLAVFFMLFFAMCMGDAGYGLVIAAGGLLMRKVESFKNMSPLAVTLGLATFVVGTLSHNFFSVDMLDWAIIPDWLKKCMIPSKIAGYDGTMIIALAIGILHLSIAMIVKTYYSTRNKGFLKSIGTWGWTLLTVGSVAVGAMALAGVLSTAAAKISIIVIGIISAIGIFLLNDIKRNPLVNIGSGLWDTYNTVTGLLGDVLSYLRLYALGLAGAMLGLAFNQLAGMVLGDGGLLWIPYILILLVGHGLNIAMCVLGAFVHPLRLNFLEFFKNSGYEGTGSKFRPLELNK